MQLNSAVSTNFAHIIWDAALYDPDERVRQTALNLFGNRVIPRELSVEELIWIESRIAAARSAEAMSWAYVLANSGFATNALLIGIVTERYVDDIRTPPSNVSGWSFGSYLKGEALFYSRWLRVFRLADRATSLRRLRVEYRRATEPRVQFWLDLARGMAGDAEVGERLLNVVEDDRVDISVRAVALRAYGSAMEGEAVPVMERFKAERGQSTADCRGQVFPMAGHLYLR